MSKTYVLASKSFLRMKMHKVWIPLRPIDSSRHMSKLHFWSHLKMVTFNPRQPIMYRYEVMPPLHHGSSAEMDPIQIARDRQRREPRFIRPESHMASVEHLLQVTCKRYPMTVVYGNLGRYPHLLSYYLDLCYGSEERVAILQPTDPDSMFDELSDYYYNNNNNNNNNNNSPEREDDGTRCDVLIYLEPKWGTRIDFETLLPNYADRMIILTSHLQLEVVDPDDWILQPDIFQTQTVFQRPGEKTKQKHIQLVHHYVGRIIPRPYPVVSAYIESVYDRIPSDAAIYKPDLFIQSHYRDVLDDLSKLDHLCIDLSSSSSSSSRSSTTHRSDKETPFEDRCSQIYLKLTNACDVMRYSNFKGQWQVAVDLDVAKHLIQQLQRATDTWKKIDGLFKNYYIEPFLIKHSIQD